MIVLTTGSRSWTNIAIVENEILCLENFHGVVFNGDCPTGVDAIVRDLCNELGYGEHRFEADWKLGPSAGPRRNSTMVEAALTEAHRLKTRLLCLAFWDGKSKGTLDTITKATRAGILVRIVPEERRA